MNNWMTIRCMAIGFLLAAGLRFFLPHHVFAPLVAVAFVVWLVSFVVTQKLW